MSDLLCRMATKFGYSTRTLFTTIDETTTEFTRPQLITAIDALITRDDLASRVLMAQLDEITEEKRLPQSELNLKVAAARPRILGALLTALSQTLAALPSTKPDRLPRMADYGLFSIAAEKALGLKPGEFMEALDKSAEQSRQIVIESSPIGEAILKLMEHPANSVRWKGTASQLLNSLESFADEGTVRSRHWPKASNNFKRQLNRLIPDLKKQGILISETIYSGTKLLIVERSVKTSTPSTLNNPKA
jgi:nucleotide-binding universal stress UspA family protein